MPWVKCIGGPCDGQVEKIDDDQVEVIKHDRKPVAMTRRSLNPSTVNPVIIRYTRRVVCTSEDGICFLAPDFMTDEEALRHALAP